MRVVLDTNVLLSAFLWQKKLKPIYRVIRLRQITPCFTQTTWDELVRTLSYPKFAQQLEKIGITGEEILRLLSVRSYFTIPRIKIAAIEDDPSDNHILACALSAKSAFIVSGDHHLLDLEIFQGIPILTPRQFLSKIP